MHIMKKQSLTLILAIGAAAVSLIAPFAYGKVIYQNDFLMRTSEAAIRSIEWKAVDYVTGYLANTNYFYFNHACKVTFTSLVIQ